MAVFAGAGDRLILANGSTSSLKRSSVPLSMYSGGSSVALAGEKFASYQEIYETQHWVGVAINKLTRQITSLPLNVYRLTGDGDAGARERVRDHPLVHLLHAPRPGKGPIYLKERLAFSALMHGNSVFEIDTENGSAPSRLNALDWRFLSPICDEAGEVLGWETTQTGERRFLAPFDVMHMAWYAGRGDIGVSPLKQLGTTLAVEDSSQRYQQASFNKGVRYSSVYILPPDVELSESDKADLRAAIQAQAGGVDQAGSMALVQGGGDIKPLSHSAVEAELIDQRRINREEIAAVFDIPPPLIGILDNATYSNISVQAKMLYGMVLGPWLGLIKETIETQLIRNYKPWADEGLFVDFDLSEVLKGEPLAEVQAIREAIGTGIMTPNEGRQARNLPPSDDPEAEKLHMPVNNLAPMGQPPATDVASTVKAHVERAADRLRDKGDADLVRFKRELTQDTSEDVAADWAGRVLDLDEHAMRALVA